MSKTFKALQRAARERQEKAGLPPSGGAEPAPAPEAAPPSAPPAPAEPADPPRPATRAAVAPAAQGSPPQPPVSGASDPLLASLLAEGLGPPSAGLRIAADGMVSGAMDLRRAGALLQRYALLHCMRVGEQGWLWFWDTQSGAAERAAAAGRPLDEGALR